MSDASPETAVAILDRLTVEEVEQRLDAADAEARALRTLLRTLRARDRSRRPSTEGDR